MPYGKLTIPLGLGLQTDIDDKLLPVGKVPTLENGRWMRSGEILKRPGSYSLGGQYAAGTPGSMPAAWQMATHKGALVSLSKAGPRPLGVYSPGLNKWMAPAGSTAADNINGVISKLRGQLLHKRGTVFRSNSAGSSARVIAPMHTSNGTYELVAWVQANDTALTATVQAQIVEIATGKTLFTFATNVTYASASCRCVFANGDFQLLIINGANLIQYSWSLTNLANGNGSASGPFTLASDATSIQFDAIASGTNTIVLYAGATTRILRAISAGSIVVSNLLTASSGAVTPGAFGLMTDFYGTNAIAAIVGSSAQGVNVHWNVNLISGVPTASYQVDATGTDVVYLTGHTISNAATGEFVVLYYKNGGAGAQRTMWGRRTVASGITNGTWIWSASIGSKTFLNNGQYYALMAYESNIQGALCAVRVPTNLTDATDGNRTPSARMCTGAIGFRDTFPPPDVYQLSTDAYLTVAKVNTGFQQIATAPTTFNTGVDTLRLTFNPSNVNGPREFADNLYVCGGVLGAFDGITFAEEGFHFYPEAPTLGQSAGGSLTLLGIYNVQAVYRYTDEFGRWRRSQESVATSISLTGSNGTIQATVKTLKLHGHLGFKNGAVSSKVVIELYMNANLTDVPYLVAVTANDETVDSVTVTLNMADTAIVTGEQLYTNGGALPFQAPPAALAVAAYKDRLAVIDADDPTLIRVSFPLVETEGPRFNDESSVRIDDARGDLVGHAALDDRLIAFKSDSIYNIPGDGPDVDGNGSFGLPSIIASGIGCSEPRSIVQTPDGIMFRSASTRSGIYMVNRGLAIEYVGAAVQSYLQDAGTMITDAVHLPGLQQTQFWLSSFQVLVYDHVTKLWSVDTNRTAYAVTAWKDPNASQARPAYAQSTSILFVAVEDDFNDVFDETSSPVEEYVATPWISAADIKGFFRFNRIQLAGATRIIANTGDRGYVVTVTLFKDFDDTTPFYTASRTMADTDDINAVEVRYSKQLSAIKVGVRISMSSDGSNFAGPKLTAIQLFWKQNTALRKIPSGNRLT